MKGNVLVIGNSGVGKSTLINAVLGKEVAKTGWGTTGTTNGLTIYSSEKIPFRVIDSIGFEPDFFKKYKAVRAVKKWSKQAASEAESNNDINVIWFCVDGCARKLFTETINNFISATSVWKSVPVIVVITKSFATGDREDNIKMVYQAFDANKKHSHNIRNVIPVVAETFALNETAYAPPEGLTELIDATNELMPEGLKAAETDIANFKLYRKKVFAQSVVGTAAAAGVVVGAAPIPFADALILAPIEIALVNALAKIYKINNDDSLKNFLNSIVEVGTVSMTAQAAVGALKSIPGLNIGAGVINAAIAAFFITAIGEGSIYAFEQIHLGNKKTTDIDWVIGIIESKLSNEFIKNLQSSIEKLGAKADSKTILQIIADLFTKK